MRPSAGMLAPEDLASAGLVGRRFRARESGIHFRGVVREAGVRDGFVSLEVTQVERLDDGVWRAAESFAYEGRPEITSMYTNEDGAVSISIRYVASLVIEPTRDVSEHCASALDAAEGALDPDAAGGRAP